MMDFLDLAKSRHAVRNYEDRKIEADILDRIIEAAHVAPTAANRQPQRLYMIHKDEMKQMEDALNFHGAQVAILVCSDMSEAWVRGYDHMNAGIIDASIVCTHMMMEAVACGLGTLWVCAFDPEKIKTHCHLAQDIEPVHVLCLGYTSEKGDVNRFDTTRKPIENILLHK